MDVQRAMAAIAEPTRYRIVLLLNEAPHTVGEVAAALGALQPQTTKHLQALEQAGVVVVHRLGRRRVAALNRENLGRLADWVSALTEKLPDEEALERYSRAIAAEPTDAGGERRVVFRRLLPAPADRVWRAWTVPEQLEQWWAPRHFVLAHQDFVPIAGHEIEMVLREGDGAEYRAVGRMLRVDTGRLLEFTLPPIGADGAPLFALHVVVSIDSSPTAGTELQIDLTASSPTPDAAPALAGLEPGWNQLLDRLHALLISAPF